MRVNFFIGLLCVVNADSQYWDTNFLPNWFRVAKSANNRETTISSTSPPEKTNTTAVYNYTTTDATAEITDTSTTRWKNKSTTDLPKTNSTLTPTKIRNVSVSTIPITTSTEKSTTILTTSTVNEGSTFYDTTLLDSATTEELRDISRTHEFYLSHRNKPQIKISTNISQNLLPLPAGASAALIKPTKYHYYPHNQHIYLLPECAIQQVCNAVYVRLNWTQPLCACPSRYRDPCSASLNTDDQHTTELVIDRYSKKALTLVKTCEPIAEMRICRPPRDWSLLALQNIRTGKSHYLVICRCPEPNVLEGPMSHDQPTYASVPGIRVFGMMCADSKRKGRPLRTSRSLGNPPFPWEKALELAKIAVWD